MSYEMNQIRNISGGFCQKLKDSVYKTIAGLETEAWITPEPVPYAQRTSGAYKKLKVGMSWGKLWDCGWMHMTGTVPAGAHGKKVALRVDVSGEGCVVDAKGEPVLGITTYASEYDRKLGLPVKRIIPFREKSEGNEQVDVWIETGCNDLFGNTVDNGTLKKAEICVCDDARRRMYYDYTFLLSLCEALDQGSAVCQRIRTELYQVALHCDLGSDDDVSRAEERLSAFLSITNGEYPFHLSAVGHAHIDLAWLWPVRETKRKAVRTFSTALAMMDRYPDYVFGASQPQLYQWVKEQQPGLYERIRERVREGRWECQGAMWVEADTNISGGESLVRQMLYGKRFFEQEFGKEMKILWLPDVFGYSGALPQIMKKSDVPYFMTIKLSWSEHNVFPYSTFRWKGIDGSEVLVHMPPENTYNSPATPEALKKSEDNYKDKGIDDQALLLFGIGDGGGGPGTEHLEYLSREKNIVGLPSVTQRPAEEFFESLEPKREKYHRWYGELYLEKHQGTYTTQAKNKLYNRRMEFALRDCEFLCAAASRAGFPYPHEELEKIWKEVLLYQFHDILPGSAIQRVYAESRKRYRVLLERVREITAAACSALSVRHGAPEGSRILFNTNGFARTETVRVKDGCRKVTVPPYGWAIVPSQAAPVERLAAVSADKDGFTLENTAMRVRLSKDGRLLSLFDKQKERETLNLSVAQNNLALYRDEGDCWDIPMAYLEEDPIAPDRVEAVTFRDDFNDGVRFTYTYGESTIVQEIYLSQDAKKLVFRCTADWRETHRMLRARYPIAVNARQAACNIQFGYIMRPVCRNTSWDNAKFEICAQKWVDLSEKGFGVALVNDCKYGYNVWDNVLSINLLRSPMYPGIDADKGSHAFSYELYLHDGDILRVQQEGYRFNTALLGADGHAQKTPAILAQSFFTVNQDNIIAETVKRSEDSTGYILRMYECEGRDTTMTLTVPGMRAARLVNLLERGNHNLEVKNGAARLHFNPFEIQTVLVEF